MAYCSKCGVSIEQTESNCPLCGYHIPEDLRTDDVKISAYPEPVNAHEERSTVVRNKIFYTYFIIALAATMILVVLTSILQPTHRAFHYSIICIIASVLYVFLLLGYIKKSSSILAWLGVLTSFMCLFLDYIDQDLTWSVTYAIPMIIPSTLIFMFFAYKYRKGKHTRHFIFIPIYMCIALALAIPIIEIVVNYNLYQKIRVTWSLVSTISLLAFSGIVSGLYYRTPEYIKERLIRIFHI